MKKTYLILIFFYCTCVGFSKAVLESNGFKFVEPPSKIQCFEKNLNFKPFLRFNKLTLKSDSTIKKKTNSLQHIISVDFGYGFMPLIGSNWRYYGEINIHYRFRYKIFMTDFNYGVSPFTNLGYFPKYYFVAGVTTNITKFVSVHCLIGAGISSPTINMKIDSGREYFFEISGTCLKTGVFINPLKSKKCLFGLEFSAIPWNYHIGSRYKSNGILLNSNFSINYLMNYVKKSK